MTNEEQKKFSAAQWRFMISSMLVYAFFFVTRTNLSMAQPGMLEEGVISTYALGTILSINGVLFGISQFVNGFWADKVNGRIYVALGLGLSALMNLFFGFTSITILFAILWITNGWVQGMGFPSCSKMLTHWIHPKELATKWSIWITTCSIGTAISLGLCSFILGPLGLNWRWCFWIPGTLAALIAVFSFFYVKDSPTEAGVHELEIEAAATHKQSSEITTADRCRLVFGNRIIWLVAIASFFANSVSYCFIGWGPTFLKQFKGISVSMGGLMIIAFEFSSVFSKIMAGWITDKAFKGRGVRMCAIYMFCAALFVFGFWALPNGGTELRFSYDAANQPKPEEIRTALRSFDKHITVKCLTQENLLVLQTEHLNSNEDKKIEDFKDIDSFVTAKLQQKFPNSNITHASHSETASTSIWLATLILMGAGFCNQGAKGMIGPIAANLATKEASAMSNGFIALVSKMSTIASGIGVAFVIENFGWSVMLCLIAMFAFISMLLFALAWNSKATGYRTDTTEQETSTSAK